MRDQKPTQVRTRSSLWLREHARWAMLLLLVLSGILMPISQDASVFFPVASAHGLAAQSTKPTPNRFNPHTDATSVAPPADFGKGKTANAPAGPPQSLKRTGSFSMQPGRLALSADHAMTFKGSDGRLEIDVPAGAVTSSDIAAAGGYISLRVSQIAPASGSSAGGSGIVSFGTYLVQAVDAQGVLLPHGLRQPATLKLHYSTRESALDLSRAVAVFNTLLPDGTDLAPLTAAVQVQQPGRLTGGNIDIAPAGPMPTMANSHFGAYDSQPVTLDTKGQALIVPLALKDPSSTASFDTDAAVATFGKPDPFNVDLNAGALTSGIPIDVPSGPGGLTPPVTLSYSSAGVSEQHNPQGAVGWAGEGWTLDMGAISWAEHNSNASCTSGCGNGWEDTWELSDPFGTSVELIPPNIQVATYYDDTGNSITASPVRWHTTPDNYAKVYSYTSTITLPDGGGVHPPCFRVFLTNGIMEEFGCTSDSLQYYYSPSAGHDFIASWHLDLITDPQGNQIHLIYASDVAQKSVSGVNHAYDRDTVLSTIAWDSPTCQNVSTICTTTGTAPNKWAPLMQVSFAATHAPPSRLTNMPSGCNTGTNLRCDDPKDLSGAICMTGYTPKGLAAPDVQSTYVLNDVNVQVFDSGTAGWKTLKDYQFSYAQNGPGTIYDPATGTCESVAGYLLLTNLVELGDDGTTALPTHTFGYGYNVQYYEDDVYHPHTKPNGATNCGPSDGSMSWNTGNGNGCLLWSQSYAPNSWYLTSADNGMGLHQTFSWANARNNTHGVNGGGTNNGVPLYCNGLSAGAQGTYPCNEVDDQNWSHIVLTQQEGDVVRASTDGDTPVQSKTSYAYKLTWPLPEQECSDCVAGMYWGNQNNGDYLDYYDAKFMGFAEADVHNPDNSLVKHKYLSTEGYGLYDATVPCLAYILPCHVSPWWDVGNAGHGHEYETDYLDTDGSTLLKKETAQYQLVCPAGGVAGSPSWSTTLNGNPYTYTWDGMLVAALDHGNPVADCDVQTLSTDSTMVNGASDPFYAPHSSTSYLYDSVGRVTDQTTGVDTGLEAQYFANSSLTGDPAFTRLDATVNNSWGTSSPFSGIGPDGFSVRWTGYVEPQYTGTYTFYTDSDDGARLWVNGTELVNNWTNHGLTENSGTIALTAGQLYSITLEYYDYTSTATIQLYWSEASQPKQIIPATALFTRSDGGGGTAYGSVPAVVTHTDYIQNNALTATSTSVTGNYLETFPAYVYTRDGGNTVHYACGQVSYDGAVYGTGQQSSLTLGEATQQDKFTGCGTAANGFTVSGQIRTTSTYDSYGNAQTTTDPDANAGNTAHKGCTIGGGGAQYSTCTTFDGTFHTLTTSTANALNQTALTGYGTSVAANGFGLWPISTTDTNGQTTTYSYDALGRMTSSTLPGETTGLTTTTSAYKVWCADPPTGAETPCVEVDSTQRLNSSATITSRAFYDGYGNLVETRSPAPNNQDVVRYRFYDPSGRAILDSIAYFVPAYTGGPGPSAFSKPDATQPYTYTSYDGLGRTMSVQDPLGATTTTSYQVECGWTSPADDACYQAITVHDALMHQTYSLVDGLGRTVYSERDTGNSSGTWGWYSETHYTYDANGNLTKIFVPYDDPATTTFSYDATKRKVGMSDPDRGTESYSYDANGNLITSVDARGSAGTIYAGYDGLNRQVWRNTNNSPTGAYVTYSYDQTSGGHGYGIGHVTTEIFTGGTGAQPLHGSYSYSYDQRGQTTNLTLTTTENATYPLGFTYNDAGQPSNLTFSDGEVFAESYDSASGWLASAVTTPYGGSQINLLTSATYGGVGGAAGRITSATLGNGVYSYTASYDNDLRLSGMSLTNVSLSTTLFNTSRSYDTDGNVTAVNTTLAAGTDVQKFCYDDLNRLTWAGSTGTPPCTGTAITSGTLTAAEYTQSFSYDNQDRLWSSPLGSYSYDDPNHLHAATFVDSGTDDYSADYDAAGDMTARAPSESQSQQQLTWDNEERLTTWQNAPSSPTSQAWYLYDGEGHRVEQDVTTGGGSDSHTYYLPANAEEVTPSGGLVKYYNAGGLALGENTTIDASGISYLASDGLGSVSEALNQTGTATSAQLYDPYGKVRYSNGTMPTAKGFTGQYGDASTGLDYYSARYYDPSLGQFTSADTVIDGPSGLNRYGYVKGNPETATDPSGHIRVEKDDDFGAGGETGDGGGTAVADPLGDAYRYWVRTLGGGGNGPIYCTIPLAGSSVVSVIVDHNTIEVYYESTTGRSYVFNATGTRTQYLWLAVFNEHETGDLMMPWHPGRAPGTPDVTPQQRAEAIAAYFIGLPPTLTNNRRGYETQIRPPGPRGPGVVDVRSQDFSLNPAHSADGPYFRMFVERGGQGGYMGFDGRQDPNAHFYLGTGGEANDLPLQLAMIDTILYQWQNS